MKKYTKFLAVLLCAATLASCDASAKPAVTPPEDETSVDTAIEDTTSVDAAENTTSGGKDAQPVTKSAPIVADASLRYLPEKAEAAPDFPANSKNVWIGYAVNSSAAGEITGKAMQKVVAQGTSSVTAKANLGYKFIAWSDGVTEPTRSGDTASENTTITAVFDYDILEMPVVLVDTETGDDVRSKTEYINAEFSIIGVGEKYALDAVDTEIRGRGNNSWGYPKKSYKFKLAVKENLFGIANGEERIWVLLANQCDQSLLRNRAAFEFARGMEGVDFAPASQCVELYLNGEYRGVYLLAEEIKVSGDRVDVDDSLKSADTGYLVELSNYASGDVFSVGGRSYQISSDLSEDKALAREQREYIESYMNECLEAAYGGDRETIEALIDIDSAVDTYLVEETIKNLDYGWDSFYLHKDKGGRLVLGPLWDFDLSLGNANEGCEYYEDVFVAVSRGSGGGNPWYTALIRCDWFRELVLERWAEITAQLDNLSAEVELQAQTYFGSFNRNFEKWKIFGTSQNRETQLITSLKSYEEHYTYLAGWIRNRIAWLDEYFKSGSFAEAEFLENRWAQWGGWGGWDGGWEASAELSYGDDATEELYGEYEILDIASATVKETFDGFGDEEGKRGFDEDYATKYCFASEGEGDIYFALKKSQTAKYYAFVTANDTEQYPERNPDGWQLYGAKKEGGPWTLLASEPEGASKMGTRNYTSYTFPIENPASFMYYKLTVTDYATVQFSEFELLG